MRSRSVTTRSEGRVVTPNPGSSPFLFVSGLASKSCCTAPVATISRPRSPGSPMPPASPTEMSACGRCASQTNCAAIAAATLPMPVTASTTGSDSSTPSQIERLGLVASDRGRLPARVAASMSSAASTAIGRFRFKRPPGASRVHPQLVGGHRVRGAECKQGPVRGSRPRTGQKRGEEKASAWRSGRARLSDWRPAAC